ncbi:hypothetical protein ABBQ32_013363 [Trebouxia sp. C0010 RCD-2024]
MILHGMRVVKHYTVPSDASDAGRQLLRYLAKLDRNRYRKVGSKAGKSDLIDHVAWNITPDALDWGDLPMVTAKPQAHGWQRNA